MLAGVNPGVIASIFTSGVFFTALAFFIIYGEKMTLTDIVGIVFICAGVSIIGIFKP
jgi:drug/metabolite transporter (DMT)-like permease